MFFIALYATRKWVALFVLNIRNQHSTLHLLMCTGAFVPHYNYVMDVVIATL